MSHEVEARILAILQKMESRSTSDKVWDISTKVAVPVVIFICGWLVGVEVRLSSIETTRFTHEDGRKLEQRIKETMPPKWLKDSLDNIQKQQGEIKVLVDQTKDRVTRLEAEVKRR